VAVVHSALNRSNTAPGLGVHYVLDDVQSSAHNLGRRFVASRMEQVFRGRFYAGHAEPQMIALQSGQAVRGFAVSEVPCSPCDRMLQAVARSGTTYVVADPEGVSTYYTSGLVGRTGANGNVSMRYPNGTIYPINIPDYLDP